jgi:hypothetical protein
MKKIALAVASAASVAAGMWLFATPTANALPCDNIVGSTAGNYACQACNRANPPTPGDPLAPLHNCYSSSSVGNFPQCQQYPTAVQRGSCNDRVLAGFPPGDTPVQ